MNILIDTNRYRDFTEGDAHAVAQFRRAESIALPFIVLAELRAGFACGTKSLENESALLRFLQKPRVRVLYADESTTRHYANLFKQLRFQATPIPTNDIWIAALSIQHSLGLFTRDSHFSKLPQLLLIP